MQQPHRRRSNHFASNQDRRAATRPERATWRAFSLTRLRIFPGETWVVHVAERNPKNSQKTQPDFSSFSSAPKTVRRPSLHGGDTYPCSGFYLKENGCFIFDEPAAQNPSIPSNFRYRFWLDLAQIEVYLDIGVLNRPDYRVGT